MENRLLGGGGGCRYAATVARIETTRAKGRQLHTAPSPTPPIAIGGGGDAKRAEHHAVLAGTKKVIINKGKKYGLRIEIRLEAK